MPTTNDIRPLLDKLLSAVLSLGRHINDKYLARFRDRQSTESTESFRSLWWGYFPVVLVALIGVSISIAIFVQSLNWEKRQVEIAFQEASQDRISAIQREIKHFLGIVQDIASFFEASEIVGRREFRKFVGPALKNQAGIKALEWVPVVPAADRPAFLEQARESFPPFRITEIDIAGKLIKSPDRSVYYPVLYVQPYQRNKEVLGLNMGANPIVSALLEEAQLTRNLQVSPGISLIDETSEKSGIVVAVPVFFKPPGPEQSEAQPNPKIRGFAVGIFYVGDIIERALENLRPGGISIDFHQGSAGDEGELLYTHHSRLKVDQVTDTEDQTSGITYSQRISVGAQPWEIVCQPASEKFKTETRNSWISFFGGIAFTILLTVYVATLVGRARQVRLEVEERTSQLWEVVQALNLEVVERKSAEQELQRLNETLEHHIAYRTAEAERRAQYLEQFAYVTSHDLKAPLRAVANLAQWIEEDLSDKLDATSREQLALLRDRVRRMHDLIEGLLEYSRVGRTSDSEILVDTKELINEIIDSLSPPDEFTIKIKGKLPTLYADRLQLGQVFSNLISNSLKHHGGDKGKIRIKGEDFGDTYQFSVCDDGQGIALEYHNKVFMMFQTLESSDFESSTGIGLALVKKIVEEHGGTIRLKSAVGEGTCFFFTWPKKRSSE
ncbi:MAG: CHASE domain-containing protein [Candidatus Thiodiazotropha sp. (ex Dulcina madagascariensis)]|nr:CHASE domain-containing protein [Candidatus Thiodiazotropha sp. (ex Dulcina madagascariensis)]